VPDGDGSWSLPASIDGREPQGFILTMPLRERAGMAFEKICPSPWGNYVGINDAPVEIVQPKIVVPF